jgi:ATPase subunit of ABC transporter with duplicated ATPase domains
MLSVQQLSKFYGIETILEKVSFVLNAGECLALVGPNGCGKTILLRVITGQEKPDAGSVSFDPPDHPVSYLTQGFTYSSDDTLASYLARALLRFFLFIGDNVFTPVGSLSYGER